MTQQRWKKKRSQTQPFSPGSLEIQGRKAARDDLFRIRGQQAADHLEAVRVKTRRRLHQHHFGARAPLRFDDEQDGDFFLGQSIS